MTKKSDGGPAFPTRGGALGGMSLRDYFAGQVITVIKSGLGDAADNASELARRAYEIADAMIKARGDES